MNELSLNTFLKEEKTRTKKTSGRKTWTRGEDKYLLQFKKYATYKEIAEFFGISDKAVQLRISLLVRNKVTNYKNPRVPPITNQEMEDFLQFIKERADSIYSESPVTKKEEIKESENELSNSYDLEPASTYQITSAEVISITRGEIVIGNYRIRGSFNLTML